MLEEHEGLRKALERSLGSGSPQVMCLVPLIGRTSSRILEWFLDEGKLTANGVLILVGDPNDASRKLKEYRLGSIYREVVEYVWNNWVIVLVDNGVVIFTWEKGKGWNLSRRLGPDPTGVYVNDVLRDGPVLMAVAHTLATGASLSHSQSAGVYAMAKPVHVERPRLYRDEDLADDITSALGRNLAITNNVVKKPGERERILAFWVAWNPSHRDTLLRRLRENLLDLFDLSEGELTMIGGSLSLERGSEMSFKSRREKADRKYLALLLLFRLTPQEIKMLGPQFSFIRDVWEEREGEREEQEPRSGDSETDEVDL